MASEMNQCEIIHYGQNGRRNTWEEVQGENKDLYFDMKDNLSRLC